MSRDEKAKITKRKIYVQAIDLIKERGYENVLIEDITQSAGVAKGTFYYYFDSKEQILTYTYKYLDQYYLEALKIAKKQSTYYTMIETFIRESYGKIEQTGKEIGRATFINLSKSENKEAFLDKKRSLHKALEYIIQVGIKNGYISDKYDPSFYVEKVMIMLMGVEYYWIIETAEKRKLSDLAAECAQILFKGFADYQCYSFHQPFHQINNNVLKNSDEI